MKNLFLSIVLLCITSFSINAQSCTYGNNDFEIWFDATNMFLGDSTELPPNTLVLPENHIPFSRALAMFFLSFLLDEGSDLYNELWSAGFGVSATSDAYSGVSALKIGGDTTVTGADLYTVNYCDVVPATITMQVKHIGNGADTLGIFFLQDTSVTEFPNDTSDYVNFASWADYDYYSSSTDTGFHKLTFPVNATGNVPNADTTMFVLIVSGEESYFDQGLESYFIIDDIRFNPPAVDNDMDGFTSDEDCDDTNADINPDAVEIPNNDVDEDCDGIKLIIDEDMDGFNSDEDCDDTDADINPDAVEIPNNDVDEDCDGIKLIIDEDMDGFNSDEDCDDTNADINPDVVEIPNNDVDEDCDGIKLIIDEDMDGFNSDEDCDDTNADINPDAVEIPNNDVDEDCDGIKLIIDEDMDGFNSDEDCDDTDADINPDAVEIPNNDVDEDCDGIKLIIDEDMDGFNSDEDCDDTDADINPDAVEIPNNNIDEDCDGEDLITSTSDFEDTSINIFPNPFKEVINIQSDTKIEFIQMFASNGSRILQINPESNSIELPTINLVEGIYFVKVIDLNGNIAIKKIVKM